MTADELKQMEIDQDEAIIDHYENHFWSMVNKLLNVTCECGRYIHPREYLTSKDVRKVLMEIHKNGGI